MQNILSKLRELTGKKHVQLTERGNKAIKLALDIAKQRGKKTVLVPDQGGWITFRKYPEKFGLETVEIKTDKGLLDLLDLEKNADSDSALLVCSMPGYCAVDNMEKIYEICKSKGCLLINDASGAIGTEEAKVGDIILGSFGRWKPVDLEYGGFIATDDDKTYTDLDVSYFDESMYDALIKKLDELPDKLVMFQKRRNIIINDLQSFDIIHKYKVGINVIFAFKDEAAKDRIISYCKEKSLEYTICPRYIRVDETAISIEVKRIRVIPDKS